MKLNPYYNFANLSVFKIINAGSQLTYSALFDDSCF
jgi:hypothetical protein